MKRKSKIFFWDSNRSKSHVTLGVLYGFKGRWNFIQINEISEKNLMSHEISSNFINNSHEFWRHFVWSFMFFSLFFTKLKTIWEFSRCGHGGKHGDKTSPRIIGWNSRVSHHQWIFLPLEFHQQFGFFYKISRWKSTSEFHNNPAKEKPTNPLFCWEKLGFLKWWIYRREQGNISGETSRWCRADFFLTKIGITL